MDEGWEKLRLEAEESSVEIGSPCVCGIYNLDRGAALLRKMVTRD